MKKKRYRRRPREQQNIEPCYQGGLASGCEDVSKKYEPKYQPPKRQAIEEDDDDTDLLLWLIAFM